MMRTKGIWSDNSDMAGEDSIELPFELGSEAHLIPLGYPNPDGVPGLITCLSPIHFETVSPHAAFIRPELNALLVVHEPGRVWRVQAKVESIAFEGEKGFCELEAASVWEIDQRRAPRYPVELPVEIGFVTHEDGEPVYRVVNGTAINMSLTGARVRTSSAVPVGAMLHITFHAAPVIIVKALAITTCSEEDDLHIGLNFVEFMDDGQLHFHEFLGQRAA
jgi:hypothetical protein